MLKRTVPKQLAEQEISRMKMTYKELDKRGVKWGQGQMRGLNEINYWVSHYRPFLYYCFEPSNWGFINEEERRLAKRFSCLSIDELRALLEELVLTSTYTYSDSLLFLSRKNIFNKNDGFSHDFNNIFGVFFFAWNTKKANFVSVKSVMRSMIFAIGYREWVYRHQDKNPRIQSHYYFDAKPIESKKTVLEGLGWRSQEVVKKMESILAKQDLNSTFSSIKAKTISTLKASKAISQSL
jgi:hypothetical protein